MKHQQRPVAAQLRSRIESLEAREHVHAAPVLLARTILGLAAPPPECQACWDAMPEQIEAELNGCRARGYHTVCHHLDLCPACGAAYLDLLETALLAEDEPLPRPPLAIDLSFMEKPSEGMGNDV